jgi:hypothetical protein
VSLTKKFVQDPNQILLELSKVTIEKKALIKFEELLGAHMKKMGSYSSK